jgi:nucleoside-diphosphate-sugar epimerase
MIILTGSTGFLGSALLQKLLEREDEVIAIKRSTSSTARLSHCLGNPRLRMLDIDLEDPLKCFEEGRIDTIIHTATEYGRGMTPLRNIINANILLPLQLAELGAKYGARCFINTDSFFNKAGYSYSNLLNYSLSKKSLLIWLDKLADDLKIINVVLEHVYGPGDSPSKFVESIIRRVGIDQIPHVALTHGHQRRDFIFVDDVVQAYLKLIDFSRSEEFRLEHIEVGTGTAIQVRDFVDQVKLISRSNTSLGYGEIPYRDDEIMSSQADIKRISSLGWKSTFSTHDGINRILSTYQSK